MGWLSRQIKDLERQKKEQRLATVREIADLCRRRVEQHDPYTKEHSVRVAAWSLVIANRLPTFDKERLERLELAALVHDYGKIKVPYEILNKRGALTPAEFAEIKKHPEIGAELLRPFEEFISMEGILYHHVRYEGGGYPDTNLERHDIPLEARIIAVADTFDAISSNRAYRSGKNPVDTMKILKDVAGTQLDPTLVKIFEDYYKNEKMKRGYNIGTETMMISASVDEPVRKAREFLRRHVGYYDRKDPLKDIGDVEGFVQATVDYLVSLSVDREAAKIFVRSAFKLDLDETFDRDDIDLTRDELDELLEETTGRHLRHKEIVLPLKSPKATYRNLQVAVFNGTVWKCIGDGNKMLLFR